MQGGNETLRVVTTLTPDEAIHTWLKGFNIESPTEAKIEDRTVYIAEGPGLMLLAGETSARAREYMEEIWGFAPNIEIGFDLSMCRDRYAPQSTIIEGSLKFLQNTNSDGGLWFDNNRKLVLLKRGNDLHIHDDANLWTPARLALLPEAYTREVLRAY